MGTYNSNENHNEIWSNFEELLGLSSKVWGTLEDFRCENK